MIDEKKIYATHFYKLNQQFFGPGDKEAHFTGDFTKGLGLGELNKHWDKDNEFSIRLSITTMV